MKCDVINLEAKKTGAIELDEAVFAVAVRPDILARAVNWQLAKRRGGRHKVKTRFRGAGQHPQGVFVRRAAAGPATAPFA